MALSPVRRRWLLLELAVFALPSTVVVLFVTGTMLFVTLTAWPAAHLGADFAAIRRAGPGFVLVLIGLACLASFWRIAIAAVRGRSLATVGMAWWLMMMAGMVIAIVIAGFMGVVAKHMTASDLVVLLVLGPALLVPATHLLLERRAA
jgi:hypothetical protein